jgi:ATP-dependent DNA helicase RecG
LARDLFTESALLKMGLNERQIQAIKLVKEGRGIALSDLQKLYEKITRKTLYRDLQFLVNKRILKARGNKKGRRYSF